MDITSYEFTKDGGQIETELRSYWPDCLTLHLEQDDIVPLIEKLARLIQYPIVPIDLVFFGEMTCTGTEELD